MNENTSPRRPWPMKWVVLAILLFILGYTAVMFFFRKPGKAHEPYREAKERATVTRLLGAGYQRIDVAVDRPADPNVVNVLQSSSAVATRRAGAGLQDELRIALPEQPVLAESFVKVTAPASQGASVPYRILVTVNMPDNKQIITGAQLLRHGNELTLVPQTEKLSGNLLARWREVTVVFTIPAASLPAGHYTLNLPGSKQSLTWELDLRQ